jgi:hypothetical protein
VNMRKIFFLQIMIRFSTMIAPNSNETFHGKPFQKNRQCAEKNKDPDRCSDPQIFVLWIHTYAEESRGLSWLYMTTAMIMIRTITMMDTQPISKILF